MAAGERGVIHCSGVQPLERKLVEVIEEQRRAEEEQASQEQLRTIQRALREALLALPAEEYDWFDIHARTFRSIVGRQHLSDRMSISTTWCTSKVAFVGLNNAIAPSSIVDGSRCPKARDLQEPDIWSCVIDADRRTEMWVGLGHHGRPLVIRGGDSNARGREGGGRGRKFVCWTRPRHWRFCGAAGFGRRSTLVT
jgi:hypothetical protein